MCVGGGGGGGGGGWGGAYFYEILGKRGKKVLMQFPDNVGAAQHARPCSLI